MIDAGYIKLFRKMTKWEWYDDINTKVLFLHLLLTVNWQGEKWHGIEVKRGQRVTSLSKLAVESKLTIKQVRTSLNKLKMTGEVTHETTNKYSLITVEKYDDYQVSESEKGKQNSTLQDKQRTIKGQAEGKQRATNKESKKARKQEDKEEKNIYPPYPLEEFSFSEPLVEKIHEWLTYKKEKKDTYTTTGFKNLLKVISKKNNECGEQPIMDLINLCMASNWKGIIWDKLDLQNTTQSKNPFLELLKEEQRNEQARNT